MLAKYYQEHVFFSIARNRIGLCHYKERQAEQSAKQPANSIGYLQDLLAGSETRLMRGVVGVVQLS